MTTSGNIAFNPNVLQIITEALHIIRVGQDGEPINADMAFASLQTLNLMVKAWQSDGLHLWFKEQGVLFLTPGQAQYGLGGNVTTHSALASDAVATSVTADATSGAFTITVDDVTGIANGDNIAIELDNATLQWTTVNGTPAGLVVTIDDALDDDVSDGAIVFAYTTPLVRPTRILQCQRRIINSTPGNSSGPIDVPIQMIERPDYYDQPLKTSESTVTQVYYDPQLITGYINVWATSSVCTDTLRFTFETPLQDFTNLVQTADFPQEWIETLAYCLADRLSGQYAFPVQERGLLKAEAMAMKEKLLGFDREYASVFFGPDFTSGGGFGGYYGGDR